MAALLLVVLSLLLMLSRVTAPFGQKIEGRETDAIVLGFRERMLYHRSGLYAFGVILLLLAVARLLSTPMQLLAVAGCYAVLMVPIRYRFTNEGIGVNGVVFRRWREFASIEEDGRSLTLTGSSGTRAFTLRVSGRHREEALRLLRRFVRGTASERARGALKRRSQHGGSL
jgi:hypothetical protein